MFNIGHSSVFFPQASQLPALRSTAPFQGGCPSGAGEHGQRWGPATPPPPSHLPWGSMVLLLPVPSQVRSPVHKPVRGDLRPEGDKGFGGIAVTCLLFLCNLTMVHPVIA